MSIGRSDININTCHMHYYGIYVFALKYALIYASYMLGYKLGHMLSYMHEYT